MLREDFSDKDLTERIIGCAFKVHRTLGSGFLEKVYENAMMIELGRSDLKAAQQAPIPVNYEGQRVGEYFADILVEGRVICELKAAAVNSEHKVQLVNYLAATGLDTGLLINFGRSVTVKRKFRHYTKQQSNPVSPVKSC